MTFNYNSQKNEAIDILLNEALEGIISVRNLIFDDISANFRDKASFQV